MNNLIASSELFAVIGMGATGLSVARYLKRQQKRFIMFDTRTQPANLRQFVAEFPEQPYVLGALKAENLRDVSKIVLSPGLAANDPALILAEERGIPIVGDIQLFIEHVSNSKTPTPIVAITGSNAKSTVTTLVGAMAKDSGLCVGVGGNLAPPALDLLPTSDEQHIDLYVLELSSFQLETTFDLGARVAVILNISADHMDRYPSIQAYHAAKQRIFQKAAAVVVNRDDALTQPLLQDKMKIKSFGMDKPDLGQYGLLVENGKVFLAKGLTTLLAADEMILKGRHNMANALAALAIGEQIQLPMSSMLQTLKIFPGLPHRCQWVTQVNGVDYIDDSKGTNVGATLAALQGLSRLPNKIVLIAGGDGKGAEFNELEKEFAAQLRAVVLIGKDAAKIKTVATRAGVDSVVAKDMQEAVIAATKLALKGDLVLLSPACASLDMFENYVDRGNQFATAAKGLQL